MYTIWMHEAKMGLQRLVNRFCKDETGDTNFISILIILGIVILLVVFFQDQLKIITDTVAQQLDDFTGFSKPTGGISAGGSSGGGFR